MFTLLEEPTTDPNAPQWAKGDRQDDGNQESGGRHGGKGGDTKDNTDDGHIKPGDPDPKKK